MKKLFYLWSICCFISCSKLEVKPNLAFVVPQTIDDFQGILDNSEFIFNKNSNVLGEVAANDFYITNSDFNANSNPFTSEVYKWNIRKSISTLVGDWNFAYSKILNCNIVLEGLEKYLSKEFDSEVYRNVKGQALFLRAYSFYNLLEQFAPVYNADNINKLSIPFRLSSDINLKYSLSTIGDAYDLIIQDLIIASELLPIKSLVKTRPSTSTAHGLLARIYLNMGDYRTALKYSNEYLKVHSELMDYNILNSSSDYPFSQLNVEVVFQDQMQSSFFLGRSILKVQPDIIKLFENNDLRKTLLFFENVDGSYGFKGNYNGLSYFNLFSGIATDEIFLIRAECNARLENSNLALSDLNTLLEKRISKIYYEPLASLADEDLLKLILKERRKELLFRGLRWSDLRRLNLDPKFASIQTRNINGDNYELKPNDPNYIFPIPKYVNTINF